MEYFVEHSKGCNRLKWGYALIDYQQKFGGGVVFSSKGAVGILDCIRQYKSIGKIG
jgi:hypothetical protein